MTPKKYEIEKALHADMRKYSALTDKINKSYKRGLVSLPDALRQLAETIENERLKEYERKWFDGMPD